MKCWWINLLKFHRLISPLLLFDCCTPLQAPVMRCMVPARALVTDHIPVPVLALHMLSHYPLINSYQLHPSHTSGHIYTYLHTIYSIYTAHNAGLGVVARVQDSPWLRRAQPPHSSQHASTGPAAPYTEAQQHLSRSTHPDSVMTSTSIVLHLCFFVTFWWLPILQIWK